jgi:hypothetical protein
MSALGRYRLALLFVAATFAVVACYYTRLFPPLTFLTAAVSWSSASSRSKIRVGIWQGPTVASAHGLDAKTFSDAAHRKNGLLARASVSLTDPVFEGREAGAAEQNGIDSLRPGCSCWRASASRC